MMGRRNWTLVTVLTVCAIAAAGCHRSSRRGGSTTNHDDDIFTTDAFPGDDVQNGNVADDGRAFSPSGQDFSGGMKCTYNGDRGTVMVTYVTDGLNLYAQYYDGASWTPPVSLNAIDITTTSAPAFANQICHAFINTSENGTTEAQARNGDCLIFWKAIDIDSDGAGSDAPNTCLFSTYFDVTEKDNVASNHGFQVFADRLNSEDEGGGTPEDVRTVALITDGLCGEARWNDTGNSYSYGDETTSIVVAWRQIDIDGGTAFVGDSNLRVVRFNPADLTAEDLPLIPSGDTQIAINGFGASNSGADDEETQVFGEFITYNGTIFFKVVSDDSVTWNGTTPFENFRDFGTAIFFDGTDITIQTVTFDLETTTFSPTGVLAFWAIDSFTDTETTEMEFLKPESTGFGSAFVGNNNSVYGSDEGLSAIAIFYVALIEDDDANVTWGQDTLVDTETDSNVMIAEVSELDGVVLEVGEMNFTDSDLFGANNDSVDEGDVVTQISRNGDYIWVAWLQREDSGASDEVGLRACQYQTTRILDDGTFPVPPVFSSSLSLDFFVSGDFDGETVHWFMFQDCLGYICGQQSDPDIMHLYYEQSLDSGADNIDDVLVSTLDADVTGFPTVPVVTTGVTWQVFEIGDQPGLGQINNEHFCFDATDSGEGGNIFSVYTQDIDGSLATIEDFRLFGDGSGLNGGFDEIDSEVFFRQTPQQILTLVCTPPGSAIGQFDVVDVSDSQDRPHAASNIHVFFAENESTESSGLGFALRTRQFQTQDDAAAAFSAKFVPNATTGVDFEFPFDLDLPNVDPNTGDDASVIGFGVCDDTVGVWFLESSHIYYQEFNGNNGSEVGWDNIDGESNPFLVDDDNDEEIQTFVTFCTKSCTCCDLDGALVFWTKEFGSGSGGGFSQRLQVRVREDGNSNN